MGLCLGWLAQGLDDAFVSQTPVMAEVEEVEGELLDPSDPTDRQQIHWRQSQQGGGGEGEAPGEGPTPPQQPAAEQAEQAGAAAAPAVNGGASPAVSSGALGEAGYAGSATSDITSATAALALSEAHGGGGSAKPLTMPAQLQKDAFLVFRALCKLSIRSSDASPGSEITTIRGKVGGRVPGGGQGQGQGQGQGGGAPVGHQQVHGGVGQLAAGSSPAHPGALSAGDWNPPLHLSTPPRPPATPPCARCWLWSC